MHKTEFVNNHGFYGSATNCPSGPQQGELEMSSSRASRDGHLCISPGSQRFHGVGAKEKRSRGSSCWGDEGKRRAQGMVPSVPFGPWLDLMSSNSTDWHESGLDESGILLPHVQRLEICERLLSCKEVIVVRATLKRDPDALWCPSEI